MALEFNLEPTSYYSRFGSFNPKRKHRIQLDDIINMSSYLDVLDIAPKDIGFYIADEVRNNPNIDNNKKIALASVLQSKKDYPDEESQKENQYKKRFYDKVVTKNVKNLGGHRRTQLHRHSNNNPTRSKKRRVLGKHTRRRLY
jgi:hypothetical protein